MAVRLVAKVKKTFGIDLPLATLFRRLHGVNSVQ